MEIEQTGEAASNTDNKQAPPSLKQTPSADVNPQATPPAVTKVPQSQPVPSPAAVAPAVQAQPTVSL